MSVEQVERVVEGFRQMAGRWQAGVTTEIIRSDVDSLYRGYPADGPYTERPLSLGGVPCVEIAAQASPQGTVLHFHGGGYSSGSSRSHAPLAARISRASGARVILVDYRLTPEHPFPAAHDDAFDAYRGLIDAGTDPAGIAISGDSSGGGMALSLLQTIRDLPLPMPACGVLMSPWADLACAGPSYRDNAERDPISSRDMAVGMATAYIGETGDPRDPRVSPAYGRFDGLPPLLIDVGDREIFRDDAITIANAARSAGVEVTLTEWPGMIHIWHLFASSVDEGREAVERVGLFIRDRTR